MCVCERQGSKEGGTPGAVVESEGSGGPAEGHGGSNFGGGKGVAKTGIRQA